MNEYPEHQKMKAVKERSQAIGEFLDWAQSEGLYLARYDERFHDETLRAISEPFEHILARHFNIDLNKIEEEKQAMIEQLRKANS